MTDLAARLLPHAAACTGLDEPTQPAAGADRPRRRRLGRAGRRGPGPAPAPIRIVTDAVGFCRLAANRPRPADLDLHVTGDPGRAARVLAAASALALD